MKSFPTRIFILLSLILLSSTTVKAQDAKIIPLTKEMIAINDSILKEGHALYNFEKVSWVAADEFLENSKSKNLKGITQETMMFNDSICSSIFCNASDKECFFEYKRNIRSGKTTVIDSVRKLTSAEYGWIYRKGILSNEINMMKDSLASFGQEYGPLNIDVVKINNNLTRVYLLQGSMKQNIIPIGNDYSFDFDSNNYLLKFRRYHKSFIPIDINNPKGRLAGIVHSHLKNNPYMTPTDICNFLLYGRDLFNMKNFYVYSNALNCTFLYNSDADTISQVAAKGK